tara:strand:- start:288 stop:740 length:453 start_codon:yes stop_codon:yes gene_type:complete
MKLDDSNNITTYWTFIFLFILVIMYRGTYSFPLNPSVKEFFNNNKLIIYFLSVYITIYIFSHSLNVLIKKENKLNVDITYLTLIFLLSVLFIMFCKGNIYSIIISIIIIILIDTLDINKYLYILPTILIISAFFYEFIKSKKNIYNFLVN